MWSKTLSIINITDEFYQISEIMNMMQCWILMIWMRSELSWIKSIMIDEKSNRPSTLRMLLIKFLILRKSQNQNTQFHRWHLHFYSNMFLIHRVLINCNQKNQVESIVSITIDSNMYITLVLKNHQDQRRFKISFKIHI